MMFHHMWAFIYSVSSSQRIKLISMLAKKKGNYRKRTFAAIYTCLTTLGSLPLQSVANTDADLIYVLDEGQIATLKNGASPEASAAIEESIVKFDGQYYTIKPGKIRSEVDRQGLIRGIESNCFTCASIPPEEEPNQPTICFNSNGSPIECKDTKK